MVVKCGNNIPLSLHFVRGIMYGDGQEGPNIEYLPHQGLGMADKSQLQVPG